MYSHSSVGSSDPEKAAAAVTFTFTKISYASPHNTPHSTLHTFSTLPREGCTQVEY